MATVFSAIIPYFWGKKVERDDKNRDKKISVYDELSLRVIGLILEPVDDMAKRKDFILAYVRAMAYADNTVMEACDKLITGFTGGDRHEGYLAITEILQAIRKDLNPKLGPLPQFLESGIGSNIDTSKKEN